MAGMAMITLNLKSGGSVAIATVPEGTTLQSLISSQVTASGREDKEDPFYMVDVGRLLLLHERWEESLPSVHPFYAVKCNNDPVLLQTLARLGCGFDCASKAEVKSILDLGVSPCRIIYANPCKQSSHLKYAAKRGVATMTFDNEVELHKVKTHYPNAQLVLRIRADDPSALCQLGVKFGCTVDEGKHLLESAREMELSVVGVSFHVGSNSHNPHVFLTALEMSQQLFLYAESLGYHFTLLDIGGGFPGTRNSSGFFTQLTEVIKDGLGRYFSGRPDLKVIAEPGRYFACSTHALAVNIISKRHVTTSPDITQDHVTRNQSHVTGNQSHVTDHVTSTANTAFMYFVNDGVYGSFNCILYDHITPTPALLKPSPPTIQYPSSLWGPTCDGLDKICDVPLPELEVGDWLFFDDMGAYTICAASNFNGFVKPKTYYFVTEDMRCRFLQLWQKSVDPPEQHTLLSSYTTSNPPSQDTLSSTTHPSSLATNHPPHFSLSTTVQGLVRVF